MSMLDPMRSADDLARDCNELARATGRACYEGERTDLRFLAAAMLARGSQSVAGANLLANASLVGDAMSCDRTVVELAIDFAYIALDPTRVARFEAYDSVHHFRLASRVAQHGGIVDPELLSALERRDREFRETNPGTKANWSGLCTSARRTALLAPASQLRLAETAQRWPGSTSSFATKIDELLPGPWALSRASA